MIGKKLGLDRAVSLAEVQSLLKERETVGPLHSEQKLALEHAEKFLKMGLEETKKCIDALMGLEIPRFKERHAVKLADVLPVTDDLVKTIFSKENITLKKEEIKKVLAVLKKYDSRKTKLRSGKKK